MPIYVWKCQMCDNLKEVTLNFSQYEVWKQTEVKCDRCGGYMNRVFSPPGTIIK